MIGGIRFSGFVIRFSGTLSYDLEINPSMSYFIYKELSYLKKQELSVFISALYIGYHFNLKKVWHLM